MKKQVNKLLKPEPKLDRRKNKEYKIEALQNNAIYISEVTRD